MKYRIKYNLKGGSSKYIGNIIWNTNNEIVLNDQILKKEKKSNNVYNKLFSCPIGFEPFICVEDDINREEEIKSDGHTIVYSHQKIELDWLNYGENGMSNCGNTCYFNAYMQCILFTYPLIYHIQINIQSNKYNNDYNVDTFEILIALKFNKETDLVGYIPMDHFKKYFSSNKEDLESLNENKFSLNKLDEFMNEIKIKKGGSDLKDFYYDYDYDSDYEFGDFEIEDDFISNSISQIDENPNFIMSSDSKQHDAFQYLDYFLNSYFAKKHTISFNNLDIINLIKIPIINDAIKYTYDFLINKNNQTDFNNVTVTDIYDKVLINNYKFKKLHLFNFNNSNILNIKIKNLNNNLYPIDIETNYDIISSFENNLFTYYFSFCIVSVNYLTYLDTKKKLSENFIQAKLGKSIFRAAKYNFLPIPCYTEFENQKIKKKKKLTNLMDCLNHFFDYEVLLDSNRNYDENFALERDKKKLFILNLPKILILAIIRYDKNNNKLDHDIDIPDKISGNDLNKFMFKNNQSSYNINYTYDLYSFVFHSGSTPRDGHYFSFIKKPFFENNRYNIFTPGWYRADDEKFYKINKPKNYIKKGYIYFYKARDIDKHPFPHHIGNKKTKFTYDFRNIK